jgi:hypothetical protein
MTATTGLAADHPESPSFRHGSDSFFFSTFFSCGAEKKRQREKMLLGVPSVLV